MYLPHLYINKNRLRNEKINTHTYLANDQLRQQEFFLLLQKNIQLVKNTTPRKLKIVV
jgi:hypothetical protein